MEKWTADKFHRRRYVVESDSLDKAKTIEVIVKVDGKTWVHAQAREPGLIAFVSKPNDQGFEIDMIQPGAVRYTDYKLPSGGNTEAVEEWQLRALGLAE